MDGPAPLSFAYLAAASPTFFAPSSVSLCFVATCPWSTCSSASAKVAAAKRARSVNDVFMWVVLDFVWSGGLSPARRAISGRLFDGCQIDHGFTEQTINWVFLPSLR